MAKSKVASNTVMLYVMTVAKLIFPLLTMPYLTRVLSEVGYGFVSYVKSCMTYMQLIVDFGFILSSVKDIVKANGDNQKIGQIAGNTVVSKILLGIVAAVALIVMCFAIDILRINTTFVILSFVTVFTTAFLADFLFRGIEKMHYITVTYLVAKTISTALTFVLVKDDSTMMWIPILDIISNLISIAIAFAIIKKLKIKISFTGLKDCFNMIKDSFSYFLSSVATTAFAALNTLLIGIYITDLTEVANWSLCLTIISAIQGLYTPITNSVYPHMIKAKDLKFIHKILLIFMPVVIVGCVICYYFADLALFIVGGEKYVEASGLFRLMIPILFFSFPAQVYGWPTLGAIGKVKQTTISTTVTAIVQVLGLAVLMIIDKFTLNALAILRFSTEALMMIIRMSMTYKNRKSFTGDKVIEQR